MDNPIPSKALVLSGGGGRGAYQVGVLRFLEEHEWYPDVIVGTSIGAVNGAAMASGHTPCGRCGAGQHIAFISSLLAGGVEQ